MGRRGWGVGLLALAIWGLAGCARPAEESGKTPETSPGKTVSKPAETPLPAGGSATGKQEVALKTGDGWTIKGDLDVPAGASKGAIILLHQRGGAASDWQPLAQALQKEGFTTLAIDQRGAGRSTDPGPTGDQAPWETSPDIAAAVESLKGKGPIGLAGASYGANNALIYAAAHPEQIKAVALFSPGADYHGLDAVTPARSYRGAVAIYHDRGDTIAGDGPQQISEAGKSANYTLKVYDGDGHGTQLLRPDVIPEVVTFFSGALK